MNRTTTSINRSPPKEASIHQEIFTNYSTSVKPDGDAENNTVTVAIDVTLLKMSFLVIIFNSCNNLFDIRDLSTIGSVEFKYLFLKIFCN